MTPWRVVAWFGVVSLAADMVYEGARSVTGPYLASLGASALAYDLARQFGPKVVQPRPGRVADLLPAEGEGRRDARCESCATGGTGASPWLP